MSALDPNIPKHIERLEVIKLDNGYCVSADTKLSGKIAHYCSNLKGVTAALWLMFEGKTKATKDQAAFIRSLGSQTKETESKEEGKDA